MIHQIDQWERCYPSNWKGLIVDQSMSHPAKFSSQLIRRIYKHLLEQDWLRVGDTVLDPFGGVALGALEAMRHGLNWIGIELEPKFVDLGSQNIASWNKRFSAAMPHWGSAVLLQGDSRYILKLLKNGTEKVLVSSPPYADSIGNVEKSGIDWSKQADRDSNHPHGWNGTGYSQAVVSSPPYESARIGQESGQESCGKRDQYGNTDGQLGAMRAGDFIASITSPPYNKTQVAKNSTGVDLSKQYETYKKAGGGQSFDAFVRTQELHSQGYGESEGQLSGLSEGDFQASLSSPPFGAAQTGGGINVDGYHNEEMRKGVFDLVGKRSYTPENQGTTSGNLADMPPGDLDASISSPPYEGEVVRARSSNLEVARMDAKGYKPKGSAGLTRGVLTQEKYGDTEGNIGNDHRETFWSAARQIVEQAYLALAPGGHAVWVVKDYVKNKQRVPFSDQWRQLCESVGFVTLHEHRASLIHHKGTSHTLEGGVVSHTTESKSFFRRLAEKKGSPRIDYETVFCMVKEAQ